MKIWITRPSAYEVYMGGMRSVKFWVEKPRYDHRLKEDEVYLNESIPNDYLTVYREFGWSYGNSFGIPAKSFLKQNNIILQKVWDEVVQSVCPKDIKENWVQWADSLDNWHQLTDDSEWEGKCQVAQKRFLLEVDIKTDMVERIKPEIVVLESYEKHEDSVYPVTDQVNSFYAVHTQFLDQYGHTPRKIGSIDYTKYKLDNNF
jgi:hypothetical protein